MDPVQNPFAPGAGSPPPELVGRDALRESVRIASARTKRGLPAKNAVLIGLRGVGKTVLLERMRDDAEATGIHTIRIEAPEGRSLPAMLAPELRRALIRLSREDRAKALAQRALRALAGFSRALKVKYQDLEVGVDFAPEPGLADNGDLEHDLADLLAAVGEAAREAGTAEFLFIDELQYVVEAELGALITALHRAAQLRLPIGLVAAGLPQLRGSMGKAKSYSERLFEFSEVGPLSPPDARDAISLPLRANHIAIEEAALDQIVSATEGYPYFLQEWGKHAWNVASASPITVGDIVSASAEAVATLDASFFRVRFDRLTAAEKRYLRAMAELGPGPHRSGEIAERLSQKVTASAPLRSALIAKGMIWSPSYGDTAFTVPLFDEFMRRIMPGGEWNS